GLRISSRSRPTSRASEAAGSGVSNGADNGGWECEGSYFHILAPFEVPTTRKPPRRNVSPEGFHFFMQVEPFESPRINIIILYISSAKGSTHVIVCVSKGFHLRKI